MTIETALYITAGTIVGNFLIQAVRKRDWYRAADISFYQTGTIMSCYLIVNYSEVMNRYLNWLWLQL